jgi:hydrogenase-4 membrane subunit HyfE
MVNYLFRARNKNTRLSVVFKVIAVTLVLLYITAYLYLLSKGELHGLKTAALFFIIGLFLAALWMYFTRKGTEEKIETK